jgi:hypothetical protein
MTALWEVLQTKVKENAHGEVKATVMWFGNQVIFQ